MRRNRKLSRKKIILGSIAAVLVVATACGIVVAMHRKTPSKIVRPKNDSEISGTCAEVTCSGNRTQPRSKTAETNNSQIHSKEKENFEKIKFNKRRFRQ